MNGTISEPYFAVVLWAEKDGSRVCIADLNGTTWLVNEFSRDEYGSVFPSYAEGWRPKVEINPQHAYVLAEHEIVLFQVKIYNDSHGRERQKAVFVSPADDFPQEVYEQLQNIAEEYDMAKRAERKQRYECHLQASRQ